MMIKKLTAVFISILFCLSLSIYALAIETDGICGNYEWEGSTVFVLDEQKHFNNGVKSAVVKMIDSKIESCVYFAFLIEFEKGGYIGDGGIRLRLNDGNSLMINLDEGITDDGGFDAEAATEYDELSFVSATEAAVYYRDSLSSSDTFKINILDLNGMHELYLEQLNFSIAFFSLSPKKSIGNISIYRPKSLKNLSLFSLLISKNFFSKNNYDRTYFRAQRAP